MYWSITFLWHSSVYELASSKKMEENTTDTTDRISTLPVFIVHHILSYLRKKNTKSLVRMTVLSKEWFALTASFPFLYFHFGLWYNLFLFKYHSEYIREMFYRYVEYTVSRLCDQNISAHTLDIYAQFFNLEQIELFGRCLDLVLEKGLQVLVIKAENRGKNLPVFCLPNTLLSASSLTSLTLCKCELPSSLMAGAVKFKSLKLLALTKLLIEEGVIEYLTKSCPILEEIYLKFCYGFKTFCVNRHHNLLKAEICCESRLERIDVEAPNLNYFLLVCNKDKAPSLSLDSCKKLTTFCYSGSPLKRLSDFLSNFPFLENVSLNLSSPVNNLKLSSHFLRRLELRSECDLEEIELNTPSLLLFEYYDQFHVANIAPLSRKHSSMSKGCMKCVTRYSVDILWYQKLRKFLEKNSIFKVLKLLIHSKRIDVEELKLIESPPYELEHVEIIDLDVDVVLWCCRPRSLTLQLYHDIDKCYVVKYTYDKLLQQENEGQTKIKFVLFTSFKGTQHFSDLNSLLKRLSCDQVNSRRFIDDKSKITFIKEEVVQEAG